MTDAHYLTSRNIKEQKAINEAVRAHVRFKERWSRLRETLPDGLPRIVIAQANIANGASGNAAIAQGAVGSLTASSKVISVLNLTGSQINSGATLVASRVAIANSGGGAWVAMLGASAAGERLFTGVTVNAIAAESSGNVTPDSVANGGEGGSAVSCKLEAAHGGENIQAGKSVIYVKRTDGTRMIIAAECNTVTPPPPPDEPTLSGFSPSDGATGVAGTVTLSWTSDGDFWDVYFGVPGNLHLYRVTTNSFDPPGTLPSGQYVWSVVANNNDGGQTFGNYLTFTV